MRAYLSPLRLLLTLVSAWVLIAATPGALFAQSASPAAASDAEPSAETKAQTSPGAAVEPAAKLAPEPATKPLIKTTAKPAAKAATTDDASAAEADDKPLKGKVTASPRTSSLPKRKAPRSFYSLRGGGDLAQTDTGLSADLGFPRVDLNYYIRAGKFLELSPEVSLLYGLGTTVPIVGTIVGSEVRYLVATHDKWRFFAYAEPGLVFLFDPEVSSGLRIGAPGGYASYNVMEGGTLMAGLKISPMILMLPKLMLSLPVLATIGGEFQLWGDYNLFVSMEFGPDVRKIVGETAETYLYVNTVFGVTYVF